MRYSRKGGYVAIRINEPTVQQVMRYEKKLGKRFKDLRDERGLKRRWVCDQLGVHYNTIKNWELGKARPGVKEILFLSKIFQVEPEEFFIDVNSR